MSKLDKEKHQVEHDLAEAKPQGETLTCEKQSLLGVKKQLKSQLDGRSQQLRRRRLCSKTRRRSLRLTCVTRRGSSRSWGLSRVELTSTSGRQSSRQSALESEVQMLNVTHKDAHKAQEMANHCKKALEEEVDKMHAELNSVKEDFHRRVAT
jgi:chromosome segregation ATPase